MTQEDIFKSVMPKREANARAMEDYERALLKYSKPRWVHGIYTGKATQICNTDNSLIVQVVETDYADILSWKDGVIRPMWRVRVVRDMASLMRSVRNPYIEAPSYEMGRAGSVGPFHPMTDDYARLGYMH